VTQLPAGATGLLIAAVMAAAMSSVDSSLNCSATLILCDIYKRYIRPDADERRSMRVLYTTTLVWGLLGTGMALAMIQVQSALDAWWKLAGIFSGGMLGLFLLGIMSRSARNINAVIGVVFGVLVISWMAFFPQTSDAPAGWRSPFHSYLTIVFGTTTVLIIGLASTYWMSRWRRGHGA
jgi:SSS family solute:Na+ symporter